MCESNLSYSTRYRRRNLRRNWWSEAWVICVDDSILWCLVAVSVTMTTGDDELDVQLINCCLQSPTIASKNVTRRRRTRTRHFCVDSREFGLTINDDVVDFGPWWLEELFASWRGWAISRTRLGRRRVAVPAMRDGHWANRTSRITNESNLLTIRHIIIVIIIRVTIFQRQILPNSTAQFVKFRGTIIPK